jgi:hypothetical protein
MAVHVSMRSSVRTHMHTHSHACFLVCLMRSSVCAHTHTHTSACTHPVLLARARALSLSCTLSLARARSQGGSGVTPISPGRAKRDFEMQNSRYPGIITPAPSSSMEAIHYPARVGPVLLNAGPGAFS